MTEYKVLTYDEACVLYDAGVREIACAAMGPTKFYGDPSEGKHIAIDYAKKEQWEPFWIAVVSRRPDSYRKGWSFCVVIE